MAAVKGFFDACCFIFRAHPVVQELSASFRSPRALTPVSALRAPAQFHAQSVWTYTFRLKVRVKNNNNNNNKAFDPKLPSRLCVSFLVKTLAGDHGFRCSRHWKLRSEAEKGAPAPLMAATRADYRAH